MCITLRCSRTGGHGDLDRVICASIAKETLDLITVGGCADLRS
jgi:hypothetical protein